MDETTLNAQIDRARKERAATINANLPPTEPHLTSMAYFVRNRDLPGKFDVQKAQALKVPVGKLYSELKRGQDVSIEVEENGEIVQKTIHSEDVLGPPVPGKAVLILDIPDSKYMRKLLENKTLNSESVKEADVVVHMLSDEVASDTKYIQWMESFNHSTKVFIHLEMLINSRQHLVMAPKMMPDNLVLPDGYLLDLDRNSLDPDIFPLPHHAGELILTPKSYSKKYTPEPPTPSPYPSPRFITDIRVGSQIDFRGTIRYDPAPEGNGIVEVKHYLGGKAQNSRLEIESQIRETRKAIAEVRKTKGINSFPGDDVEVMTLGTGSAIPNKYRNGIISRIEWTDDSVL